jgi:hypothetical protein
MKKLAIAFFVSSTVAISGCATQGVPKEALKAEYVTTQQRSLQTRTFDTLDEKGILSASASVLQDLGFTLSESETDLGLLVGEKARDATESGQVAGAVAMAVLFGVQMSIDKEQKIRVSVVTKKAHGEDQKMVVRATFQRLIWNQNGVLHKMETINDPEIYQGFFENLSKSVFLEANA